MKLTIAIAAIVASLGIAGCASSTPVYVTVPATPTTAATAIPTVAPTPTDTPAPTPDTTLSDYRTIMIADSSLVADALTTQARVTPGDIQAASTAAIHASSMIRSWLSDLESTVVPEIYAAANSQLLEALRTLLGGESMVIVALGNADAAGITAASSVITSANTMLDQATTLFLSA